MKFNIKKFLKILTVWLVCALASIFFLFAGCSDKSLNMRSDNQLQSPEDSEYGIYTKLTLTLDCGDGKVWATVKNTYTLLPSTVRVTVELYKSERPVSSYREMELAAENSINDLDIFQTVTAEAPTGGRAYYWQARMYYRIDNGDWQERVTNIMLISYNGKIISVSYTPEEETENIYLKDIITDEARGIYVDEYFGDDREYSSTKYVKDSANIDKIFSFFKNIQCEKISSQQYTYEEYHTAKDSVHNECKDEYEFRFSFSGSNRDVISLGIKVKNSGCILGYCSIRSDKYTSGSELIHFQSKDGSFNFNSLYNYINKINSELKVKDVKLDNLFEGNVKGAYVIEDDKDIKFWNGSKVAYSTDTEELNKLFKLFRYAECEINEAVMSGYVNKYDFAILGLRHNFECSNLYKLDIEFENKVIRLSIGDLGCIHGAVYGGNDGKVFNFLIQEGTLNSNLIYGYLEKFIESNKIEKFTFNDIFNTEPSKVEYKFHYSNAKSYSEWIELYPDIPYVSYLSDGIYSCEEDINEIYGFFSEVKLTERCESVVYGGSKYRFYVYFDNGIQLYITITSNGQFRCTYFEQGADGTKIISKLFLSDENAVDMQAFDDFMARLHDKLHDEFDMDVII